jgi:trehalose 6-phosphate synthase/phosphatase
MLRALELPSEQRRARMAAMRDRIRAGDVHAWASAFIEDLERPPAGRPAARPPRAAAEWRRGVAPAVVPP